MSKDRKGAVQTHGNLVQMKNSSRGTPDLRIASPKGFSVPEETSIRDENARIGPRTVDQRCIKVSVACLHGH